MLLEKKNRVGAMNDVQTQSGGFRDSNRYHFPLHPPSPLFHKINNLNIFSDVAGGIECQTIQACIGPKTLCVTQG
jgi:hypothetical protein